MHALMGDELSSFHYPLSYAFASEAIHKSDMFLITAPRELSIDQPGGAGAPVNTLRLVMQHGGVSSVDHEITVDFTRRRILPR